MVRRDAWAGAALALALSPLKPPAAADSALLVKLWCEERRAIEAYLRDRGYGLQRSPPGGVGGPMKRRNRKH